MGVREKKGKIGWERLVEGIYICYRGQQEATVGDNLKMKKQKQTQTNVRQTYDRFWRHMNYIGDWIHSNVKMPKTEAHQRVESFAEKSGIGLLQVHRRGRYQLSWSTEPNRTEKQRPGLKESGSFKDIWNAVKNVWHSKNRLIFTFSSQTIIFHDFSDLINHSG